MTRATALGLALSLASCRAADDAGTVTSYGAEAMESMQTSSSAATDVARNAAETQTRLAFGPIPPTAVNAPLRLVITEQADGSADQTLRYEARTEGFLLVVGIDYKRLQQGPVEVGGDALTDIYLENTKARQSWMAIAGSIEAQAADAALAVDFDALTMHATDPANDPADQLDSITGSVTGKVERVCAYRTAADAGAPALPNGATGSQLVEDPSWTSAFCSQYRQ